MFCSILISNFNKSQFIERCLNSLINQSYKNFEIIFSDNGSTDNSLEIVSKFNGIKVIKTPRFTNSPALNQIDVLNNAFLISKGEYIFLLDSDDFYETNKIEKIINHQKKKKLEFVCDVPRIYFSDTYSKIFKIKSSYSFLRSWPIIFPTSTISFTRNFFLNFNKFLLKNEYDKLEIDFRLNVYAYLENINHILSEEILTNYSQSKDGIMSSYKKFDKNWWDKRLQAHMYFHKIQNIKKLKLNKNLDFYVTKLINKL